MRTDTGRAHELWREDPRGRARLRPARARLQGAAIGHTETGIATVIRDYLPARGTPDQLRRMLRHWMSAEEHAALDWDVSEHLCSPAELRLGAHHRPAKKNSMVGKDWSTNTLVAAA